MMHLFMGGAEVDFYSHHHPTEEYYVTYAAAQQWANQYGVPVEVWEYEGHETIADGERVALVWPQPVQLGVLPGADVVLG